jgi:hypothetical protein
MSGFLISLPFKKGYRNNALLPWINKKLSAGFLL